MESTRDDGAEIDRPVFVYVTGEREPAPSAVKGYMCTAADIVDWWDASGRRLDDHARLVRLARACLRGDSDAPLRGVRTARGGAPGSEVDGLTLDGLVEAAAGPGGPGARTRLVANVLNAYARRRLAPAPALERAGRVYWAGAPGEPERSVSLIAEGRRCGTRLADVLADATAGRTHVVMYDAQQAAFVRTHVGPAAYAAATRGLVVVLQKEFCRREKLADGLPLSRAAALARVPTTADDGAPRNPAAVCRDLAAGAGMLELVRGLSSACRLPPQVVVDSSISARCARMTARGSENAPPRPVRGSSTDRTDIVGGLVLDPVVGLRDGPIVVLDFKSMYPSVIASGAAACHPALADRVRELVEERTRCQSAGLDTVARGCKLAANSIYGQLGNPRSPCYDPEAANAVTAAGRELVTRLAEALRADGATVVYGDTDSCMAAPADGSDDLSDGFVERFNASLPPPVRVVREATHERMLVIGKKKYVARDASGEWTYKGTMNVRADTPPRIARLFESVVARAFDGADADAERVRALAAIACAPDHEFEARVRVTGKCQDVCDLAFAENARSLANYERGDSVPFTWVTDGTECRPGRPNARWRVDRSRYARAFDTAARQVVAVAAARAPRGDGAVA